MTRANDVPSWVLLALSAWGKQKRRIWEGGAVSRNGHRHIDGYANSLLGRIREEREGAGQGARTVQHWPEVYHGQALEVQRALIGIPERPHLVLHLHYVFPREATAATKAGWAGVARSVYFHVLSLGQVWTHAKLEAQAQATDPIACIDSEISRMLQSPLVPRAVQTPVETSQASDRLYKSPGQPLLRLSRSSGI